MAATSETDERWNHYAREWKEKSMKKTAKATFMTHAKAKKLDKLKSYKEQFFQMDYRRIEWFDAPGLKRPRGGIDVKLIKDVVLPSAVQVPSESQLAFDIVHEEDKKKKPKMLRQTIICGPEQSAREAMRFYVAVRETWLAHPFTVRDKGVTCPGKPPTEPHSVPLPDHSPGVIEVEGTATRGAETLVRTAAFVPGGTLVVAGEEEHGVQLWAGSGATYTMAYAEAGAGTVAAVTTSLYVDEHVVGVGYASGRLQVLRASSAALSPFLTFQLDLPDGGALTHLCMASNPPLALAAGATALASYAVDRGEQNAVVALDSPVVALAVAETPAAVRVAIVTEAATDVLVVDGVTLTAVFSLPVGAPAVSVVYSARDAVFVVVTTDGRMLTFGVDAGAAAGQITLAAGAALAHVAASADASVAVTTSAAGSELYFASLPDLAETRTVALDAPVAACPTFVMGSTAVYDQADAVLAVDWDHPFAYGQVATSAPTRAFASLPALDQLLILGSDGTMRFVTKVASRLERCARDFEHKVVALQRWKEKAEKDRPKVEAYQREFAEYSARLQAFEAATTVSV